MRRPPASAAYTQEVEDRAKAPAELVLGELGHGVGERVQVIPRQRGQPREAGPLDADELAERVGLHRNTVRAHLGMLERAGLLKRETERSGRPGRPRVRYHATPEPASG